MRNGRIDLVLSQGVQIREAFRASPEIYALGEPLVGADRRISYQVGDLEAGLPVGEQERARMSRDVHDILCHSLTVITVKSELVGRLLEAVPPGPAADRARAEVADVGVRLRLWSFARKLRSA